jgi:hypothetical protein
MDINALEVIRNILLNYSVSNELIKTATDFGLVYLVLLSSTVISAGVYLNIYNTPMNKNKTLFIEKINKLKNKVKSKKKEHI